MLRFSNEEPPRENSTEEVASIRDPYGVFFDAYEAAEEGVRNQFDDDTMTEKFRDANAAARTITDPARRDGALDQVIALEAKWRFPSAPAKDATPGGTADLRQRFDEFLGKRD